MRLVSFLFDCQRATLHIEQRTAAPLAAKPRAQLWAHLRRCPCCRRYEFQTHFIARQASAMARATEVASEQLPAAARLRLQQQLNADDLACR